MISDLLWKRNYERHISFKLPNYLIEALNSAFLSLKEYDQLNKCDFSSALQTNNLTTFQTFRALCFEILMLIQTNKNICNFSKTNGKKLVLKDLRILEYKKNNHDSWHTQKDTGELRFFICLNSDKSNRKYKKNAHNDTEIMIGNVKNRIAVVDSKCGFYSEPVKNKLLLAVGILQLAPRDNPLSEKIYWLRHDIPKKTKIFNKFKRLWN